MPLHIYTTLKCAYFKTHCFPYNFKPTRKFRMAFQVYESYRNVTTNISTHKPLSYIKNTEFQRIDQGSGLGHYQMGSSLMCCSPCQSNSYLQGTYIVYFTHTLSELLTSAPE